MTTINLAPGIALNVRDGVLEAGVREPTGFTTMTTPATISWDPDLTAQELTTVNLVIQLVTGKTLLTPTDWAAIAPRLDALRVFRQQSQSEFMAKTANQKDRELFDAMNDVSAILLRVLRTT